MGAQFNIFVWDNDNTMIANLYISKIKFLTGLYVPEENISLLF